jgi:t-SNARE complex subunit (syntaxin)
MEVYTSKQIDQEILEETDEEFKQILENMKDINSLIETLNIDIKNQGEELDKIEDNTEDAIEYIEEGNEEIVLAKFYDKINKKKIMAISGGAIAGCVVGTCVGGFFGIIPGMIVGGIGAGLGAGTGIVVDKFK